MSDDEMLELLANERAVGESYVLLRELKLYLEIGHESFHPCIRVKLWKSRALPEYPYHYTVSHYVHTPVQAGPYHPSCTEFASEAEAIRAAISNTIAFLQPGIREGHEPEDRWLVPNDDF